MARPVKWRRVEKLPEYRYFVPSKTEKNLNENTLKIEELEAIRLRDLEGLEQEECANSMEISRQTFQRIYNEAKKKVADSLINGKAIRITGGNYTQHICKLVCEKCGNSWQERVEDLEYEYDICPKCGSPKHYCKENKSRKDCRKKCCKMRNE